MANIFRKYVIFDSEETYSHILNIIKKSSEIRLTLGNEYVSFVYDKNEDLLYPTEGNIEFFMKYIRIQDYNTKEFYTLLCEVKLDMIYIYLKNMEDIPSDINNLKLKIVRLDNHSKTITDLEKIGYVNTFLSNNIMAVDKRRFKIQKEAIKYVKELDFYLNRTYEVDSLGTSFFLELTTYIKRLWKIVKI